MAFLARTGFEGVAHACPPSLDRERAPARQLGADTSVLRSQYAGVIPRADPERVKTRNTGGMPTTRATHDGFRISDVLAVVLVVIFAVLPFPEATFRATGILLIPALAPAAIMPFRRRWPLAAVGVGLAGVVIVAAAGSVSPSALLAVAVACFAVFDRRGRRVGLLSLAVSVVVAFLADGWALDGDLFDATALQFILIIVLGAALGDTARSRREFAAAMTERAERAERSRDDEARRRVAEDRVRIARDLHDVVAHQIAVISLNAGVASSALETRPERAREALRTIRAPRGPCSPTSAD